MKQISLFTISLLFLSSLAFAPLALAKLGVGVATGKIVVEEPLYPGTIHNLPPLNILNTGDETAVYRVSTAYHETQWEKRPAPSWFTFKPNDFELKPGESQAVAITLQVPVKTEPGQYFAYLEGSPLQKSTSGTTSIGIAAAAKLYFEIAPANLFVGLYYRLLTFWQNYLPWTNVAAATILGLLLLRYLQTHFHFQVTKKPTRPETDE